MDAEEELAEPPRTNEWKRWEMALRDAITFSEDIPEKWKEWMERIQEAARSRIIANDEIEALYRMLVENILPQTEAGSSRREERNERRKRGSVKNGRKPRNDRRRHGRARKPPNRRERKAYSYARSQDLFNNEPKKLADIVAANDFSLDILTTRAQRGRIRLRRGTLEINGPIRP